MNFFLNGLAQAGSTVIFINRLKMLTLQASAAQSVTCQQPGSRILYFLAASALAAPDEILPVLLSGGRYGRQISKLLACYIFRLTAIKAEIRSSDIIKIPVDPFYIVKFCIRRIAMIFQYLPPRKQQILCKRLIFRQPL